MKKLIFKKDFVDRLKEIINKSEYQIIYSSDLNFITLKSEDELKDINFFSIRQIQPLKQFFFYPKEELSNVKQTAKKRIIVGIKSCDLQAIKVLDRMFISDYIDENYKNYRENTVLISTDCLYPKETCFCSIVNGRPFVEEENAVSDINISFIDEENFILESFTSKGKEILENYFSDLKEPSEKETILRNKLRENAVKNIFEFNNEFLKEDKKDKYYKTLKNTYVLEDVWKKESEKCVQCGGCNFICPSCYCFLIREASKSHSEQYRDKVWDVCHFTGYSRVAGGANPRKYKYQRFRNRYQCKFVYRYENFGFYACTGCGRCIEVCPAKIDIRKVIRNLVLAKGEEVLVKK